MKIRSPLECRCPVGATSMTVEEWAKQQQNSAEAELLRAAGAPRQPVSEVAAPRHRRSPTQLRPKPMW